MTVRVFNYFETGRTSEDERGTAIRIDPVYENDIIVRLRLTDANGSVISCGAIQWEELRGIGTAEVSEPHEVVRRAWVDSVRELDPDRIPVSTEYDDDVWRLMAQKLGVVIRNPKR